jgi:hypothetical protein
MQCIYQCTHCGTGWLAKKVEPRGQGWAVDVFICNRCRYASQPSVSLAVEEGEDTLPVSIRNATVPVARLTGPGIEALGMEEIFRLMGLLPDASEGEVQRPALADTGSAAGV